MSVLVTGGCGYIGAHVVRLLSEAGNETVVVDDLSTGSSERVRGSRSFQLDIAAPAAADALAGIMIDESVDAVIHLAAKKQVGESVERPLRYYRQNVDGALNVADAALRARVDRFVFSSTAAVYGVVEHEFVDEHAPTDPISPYGRTKLVGEWVLRDLARASGLRAVTLRYFNVAGAGWPDLGDPQVLNLVTLVIERIRRGEPAQVYGDDFPTPDGSGVRDYIHVLDLADAHLAALAYLDDPDRRHDLFNVGTGVGSSVLEVIAAIARASGRDVPIEVLPRRVGDAASVVADPSRITGALGWRATRDLDEIVRWAWEAAESGSRRPERGAPLM